MLRREAQRRPARRQHEQTRRRGEQLSDQWRAGQELLEVVEHEQHPQRSQVLGDAFGQRSLALPHVERFGDRRQEQIGARDRSELDKQGTVP